MCYKHATALNMCADIIFSTINSIFEWSKRAIYGECTFSLILRVILESNLVGAPKKIYKTLQ